MTGEGSHDFARVRRIVKTDEFSSVFRLRPAQKTAHFVLYTRPNALPHARLGVVAAKRFAPRAVTRNTIKRITRELFRTTPLPAIDCIVRLARPVNTKAGPATNTALKTLLHAELAKLFASQAPRTRKPAPPSNNASAADRGAGVPATGAPAAGVPEAATPPGSGPRSS
jgi:ribonuclease P protein component